MDEQVLTHHLMIDPDPKNPELVEAARSSKECADALQDSQRFEKELGEALMLPVHPGRAEDVIARRQAQQRAPALPWMLASAAAVLLAVGVAAVQFLPENDSQARDLDGVWLHVAEHWQHDGARVLAASQIMQSEGDDIESLLAGLGVDIAPELTARVTLGKLCPTPDGNGAHLILDSDDGPITLIVMPGARAPGPPTAQALRDGQQAWLVGLDHGSVAVIANPDQGAFDIARQIRRQISIDDPLLL